jgi:hypothetical protein
MEQLILYDDPLEIIERTLRDVIHDVLSSKHGPNWHQDNQIGLGPEWVQELERKKKADEGVLKPEVVYDFPLAFAEFSDLGELLKKHKGLFLPIFEHWDTFMSYCRTAENLRNIVKHHRDLAPSQHHLLYGIAGEIESAVNYWRIDGNPNVKKTRFQFADYVAIEGKSEAEILSESAKCVSSWKESFLEAAKCSELHVDGFKVTENKYQCNLQGQHLTMEIRTSPNAQQNSCPNDKPSKRIHGELVVSSGFRANLDALLGSMGKAYLQLAYDLDENIDLEALRKWSSERAGLNPVSTGIFNQELTGVEYSFLGGKIRIGAWKYAVSMGTGGSRLFVTTDSDEGFWRAHVFLDLRKLLGFMLGSITPKAMMHLFNLSQIPFENPDKEKNQ